MTIRTLVNRHSSVLLAGIHRAGAPVTFVACRVACHALIKTFALRGYKPGLGPAAEILSLRRQRTYSKKGAPGVVAPCGVPICAVQKMGKSENSLRSNIDLSLSIFCIAQMASTHGNSQSQKQLQPQTRQQPQPVFTLFPHKHIHPVTPSSDKVKIAASFPTLHNPL
jgi:hypothetical protein